MNKKFENLEKKLNIATSLVSELTEEVEDLPELTISSDVPAEIQETVFTLDLLKTDFMLIRNNILKLVSTGQRVLDTASVLDVTDMKASQLQALSEMQSTIGNNLKLLISIYKDIAEIEKLRIKEAAKQQTQANVNMGTVVNNNIVYSGSTTDLLQLIKDNK